MLTFLFCAGSKQEPPRRFLRRAAAVVAAAAPTSGPKLAESYVDLPEIDGGWISLVPADHDAPSIISHSLDDDLAILAFGDAQTQTPRTCAKVIRDGWLSGGADRVHEIEGCFSAVIVDRRSRKVSVVSDLLGRRSLRFAGPGGVLLVSPHDLSLVATGLCPLDFDPVTAASILAVDWSLDGRSLLGGINTCYPTDRLQWHDGVTTSPANPPIIPDDRIASNDRPRIARQRDLMINAMRENTRLVLAAAEDVVTDLTAGLDSRSVLALLLAEADASRLRTFTKGAPGSLDMRVARRLSAIYCLEMLPAAKRIPAPDTFIETSDLLAFHTNGDTNSKRAIDEVPAAATPLTLHACGLGGEMFRGGCYYTRKKKGLTAEDALEGLIRGKPAINSLPWRSTDMPHMIADRFTPPVEKFARISADGHDVTDLFYLYERVGVWGAFSARVPWLRRRWSPYLSPALVRMSFSLPPPIGDYCLLHEELIRRYAPRAWWRPVNRYRLLPLPFSWPIERFFTRAERAVAKAFGRLLADASPEKETIEKIRAAAIAGPLAPVIRDLLLSADTFASDVFGRENTELLLNEHISGRRDHRQTIGLLVTMERYRQQLQKARQLARPS